MTRKLTVGSVSIYQGDCREVLRNQLASEKFDFIFADPPFNIGQKYDGYEDAISHERYRNFTTDWIRLCFMRLRENGVFAIHVPDAVAEFVIHLLYNGIDGMEVVRREWVIWHYRFGQCVRSKFINSKCHCLIYQRGRGAVTFNSDAVLVDSDRAAAGDKRTAKSATPGKRVPFDVFGIPSDGSYWGRVTGSHSNAERMPSHPNQLPEKYLERLIRAYTNQGNYVLDPFGGTGTTAAVGSTLKREVVTIEQSEAYCQDIYDRCKRGAVRVRA